MKFILVARHVGETETWEEMYVKNVENAEVEGRSLIDYFNSTLRPGEKSREFVSAREVGKEISHDWDKDLTRMSTFDRRSQFDGYTCRACGITGKRRSIDSGVVRDSKYRAKKFYLCTGKRVV